MNYHYVFFDQSGDYFKIARSDLLQLDNCVIRERNLSEGSWLKKQLFRFHTGELLNRNSIFPFQSLWNRAYLGDLKCPDNKPICFVFDVQFSFLRQLDFYNYLRKRYDNCRLVLLLRDKVEVAKRFRKFDLDWAVTLFDRIYITSNIEAQKYHFEPINVMCSYYPVKTDPDKMVDVIFIGVVKDRLDTIVKAYEKFTEAGLVCDFLLVNKEPIPDLPEGIVLRDKGIPYPEMLQRTVNAKCVLEVTQKNTDALTSRYLEALCYNKKLLSDNMKIKESKYYDPRYMCAFKDIDEVDPEFIKAEVEVDYQYAGDYSPIRMLEYIDQDLKTVYGR